MGLEVFARPTSNTNHQKQSKVAKDIFIALICKNFITTKTRRPISAQKVNTKLGPASDVNDVVVNDVHFDNGGTV